jgi:hypothetical protein
VTVTDVAMRPTFSVARESTWAGRYPPWSRRDVNDAVDHGRNSGQSITGLSRRRPRVRVPSPRQPKSHQSLTLFGSQFDLRRNDRWSVVCASIKQRTHAIPNGLRRLSAQVPSCIGEVADADVAALGDNLRAVGIAADVRIDREDARLLPAGIERRIAGVSWFRWWDRFRETRCSGRPATPRRDRRAGGRRRTRTRAGISCRRDED